MTTKIECGADARALRDQLDWTLKQVADAAKLFIDEVREAERMDADAWNSSAQASYIVSALLAEQQRQARDVLRLRFDDMEGDRRDTASRLVPELVAAWEAEPCDRLAEDEADAAIIAALRKLAGEEVPAAAALVEPQVPEGVIVKRVDNFVAVNGRSRVYDDGLITVRAGEHTAAGLRYLADYADYRKAVCKQLIAIEYAQRRLDDAKAALRAATQAAESAAREVQRAEEALAAAKR